MLRTSKREAFVYLEVWRARTNAMVRTAEIAHLQLELEAKAADDVRGTMLRRLRETFIRIMKGEVSMRVEVWRAAVKRAAYLRYAKMRNALEAQTRLAHTLAHQVGPCLCSPSGGPYVLENRSHV